MDQVVTQFRERAGRENRGRRGIQRRYSAALRHEAVVHWARRRREGVGLREVAEELGIASWSLHRWATRQRDRGGFQAVAVVDAAPVRRDDAVVIVTPQGFRVEGLGVDGAVRHEAALRFTAAFYSSSSKSRRDVVIGLAARKRIRNEALSDWSALGLAARNAERICSAKNSGVIVGGSSTAVERRCRATRAFVGSLGSRNNCASPTSSVRRNVLSVLLSSSSFCRRLSSETSCDT